MIHNKGKSQSLEADSEVTQIIDSLDKYIKTVIITISSIFRNIEEGVNIQKDSNQTLKDKNVLWNKNTLDLRSSKLETAEE